MAPRPIAVAAPVFAMCAAALLIVSGPASAIYVVEPLKLRPSAAEAQAGDEVTLGIERDPEYEGNLSYADRDVTVRYHWNAREGQEEDPEAPTSSADEVSGDVGSLRLDASSRGSIAWTIPAEADDKNVFFQVLDDEGQVIANAHVRVGDAEPIMMIMNRGGDGAIAESGPSDGAAPSQDDASGGAERSVPAPAPLLAAGVVALAAIALRRR